MKVYVNTTGYLCGRDQYKKNLELELPEDSSIADLLGELKLSRPKSLAIFIDHERVRVVDKKLRPDSTIEIFSLIGGG